MTWWRGVDPPHVETGIMFKRGGVDPPRHIETGLMTQRGRSTSSPHQDRNNNVVRRGRPLLTGSKQQPP